MRATRHNTKHPRHGLTLIELLVVVFIILTVSAAVVPVIAPTAAGRRQREAARVVSTFLSSARTRAIEIGRPAGVWLEGTAGDRGAVVTLSYCEVPPSYAGLMLNSTVKTRVNGVRSEIIAMTPVAPIGMIRKGDLVSLKYGAAIFQITQGLPDTSNFVLEDGFLAQPSATDPWVLESVLTTAPPTIPDGDYAFEILRQPRKSIASSVELPPGTVIDLYYSGDDRISLLPRSGGGPNSRFYSGDDNALRATSGSGIVGHNEPVILLFGTGGTPDSVFRLNATTISPAVFADLNWRGTAMTRPLYLMIGKLEKVDALGNSLLPPADPLSTNLVDVDNYWVSVNPLTGTVTTDQVAIVNPLVGGPTMFNLIQRSRAFAIEKLGIGGR